MIHKLYKNQLELFFNEKRHTYEVKGQIVPGVTGITGVIDKPGLIYWGINCTLDYLREHLQPGELLDEVEFESLLEEAKHAHRRVVGKAASVGSLVHKWIEKKIKGKRPT